MSKTDDLSAWRVFVTVARSGTLSAAAKALDVEVSSISRAIGGLEKALGCELIRRNMRPMKLTEAGQAALKRMETILRAHDGLMEALVNDNRALTGRVRLSSAPGFATRKLVPFIREFTEAHPGISVDIQTGGTEADVAKGFVDVAVITGEPTLPGLWRGDAGGLKLDARRALVQLLKGPVLDGMRMPVIWKALLESEDLIRSRLNDLFLDLVIDREQLFAFTRQADTDPVKAPILLKRKPLNYIETYLFLFLRLRLSSAEGRGERAVIGLDEIREHLADIAGRNRDAVGFERHLAGAVTKADHFGVLRRLKSGEDAFEISPVLKMLMTAELVEQVKDYYEGRAVKPGEAAAEIPAGIENDESEDEDDEDDAEDME